MSPQPKESPQPKFGACPLCARQTHLTFHHFIPRKVHRRAHFKKHYNKAQLNQGVEVCRECHRGIHQFYDEMHLAKNLPELDLLQKDEALSAHFAWVARQRVR
ncbi:MAG: hypothetical protein HKN50_10710 [Gammaproteobacteria bacterium]|nr:hypothetical protein [Gammaproteobacteria bacterium]